MGEEENTSKAMNININYFETSLGVLHNSKFLNATIYSKKDIFYVVSIV